MREKIYIQREFHGVVLVVLIDIYIKLTHIYIYGDGVETPCEGSDIYETRIILAVYIQGPAAGFSTSPC